ncbi:LamG domain-containing protein [Candidatus Poribacteria bacterium]|nr:LamG domain-containing protein [Candidatus Poribacteria bacterium]
MRLLLTLTIASLIVTFPFIGESIDDESLALYLPFNEGSGNIAGDFSGKENDGALQKGPKWVDGKFGKALLFDGEDDYVEVEEYIPLDNRPFTLEAWVYRAKNQKESWDAILTQIESLSGSKGLHFGMRRDNEGAVFTLAFYGNDVNSTVPIEKETWYHLTGVYTGKKQQLFINGKLNIERDAAPYGGTKGNIFIGVRPEMEGAAPGTHGLHFDGIIDELAVYQKALTEAEINQDMELIKNLAVFPSGKLSITWAFIKMGD